MKRLTLLCLIVLIHFTGNSQSMLPTVEKLDLSRYQGTWYEIARLPNSFEKNLTSVTATYTLKSNGKIAVLNQGYKNGKKKKAINGVAWRPNSDFPGRLKVRFFWPFAGNYYVIHIDENYQYALVGSPSRKFLWLLSKEVEIPNQIYQEYTDKASEEGFRTEELIKVDQSYNSVKNNR